MAKNKPAGRSARPRRDSQQRERTERRSAMAVLAGSGTQELAQLVAGLGKLPGHEDTRQPESGLVMLRGRIGGDGAPFHFGEATVTRAAVRLATGEDGFGYVLGRDKEKARLIALCDAMLRCERYRDLVERRVLEPIRTRCAGERSLAAERTAATRVDFFTLVRGED